MTVKELRFAIVAAGGEVPTEGSGTDGAVVKADLEAALEALQGRFIPTNRPGIRRRTN